MLKLNSFASRRVRSLHAEWNSRRMPNQKTNYDSKRYQESQVPDNACILSNMLKSSRCSWQLIENTQNCLCLTNIEAICLIINN
jgi:hypothetical protein